MLLVPVLLAVLAMAVHGRPQPVVREQDKLCSKWMTTRSARNVRSNYECAGRVTIERRGFQARVCCPASFATRSDEDLPTDDGLSSEGGFPTECGKQKIDLNEKRIVGGAEAKPNSWPWAVHINANGQTCGGSLIDTRHVLTAAHCIANPIFPENYIVTLARHDISVVGENEQELTPEKIFVHEDYKPKTWANDIAIMRLPQSVQISAKVNTICLPGPEASDNGDKVWSVGWGKIVFQGELSSVLKQVELTTMSDLCEQTAEKTFFNKEKEMCAAVEGGGQGTCHGDSGGPLMYKSDGTWYLDGVVSRGYKCAHPEYPGIFTRVAYYRDWINNIINNPSRRRSFL